MNTQQAETVMLAFNLSDESYDSLPRGLASELHALLVQQDELLAACKAALTPLRHLAAHGTLPDGYKLSDLPVSDLIVAIANATKEQTV